MTRIIAIAIVICLAIILLNQSKTWAADEPEFLNNLTVKHQTIKT